MEMFDDICFTGSNWTFTCPLCKSVNYSAFHLTVCLVVSWFRMTILSYNIYILLYNWRIIDRRIKDRCRVNSLWVQWLLQLLCVSASISRTWCRCPRCWTLLSRHVLQTLALCSLSAELSGLVSVSPRGCYTDVPAGQFRTSKCMFILPYTVFFFPVMEFLGLPLSAGKKKYWLFVQIRFPDKACLWLSTLSSKGEFLLFF